MRRPLTEQDWHELQDRISRADQERQRRDPARFRETPPVEPAETEEE